MTTHEHVCNSWSGAGSHSHHEVYRSTRYEAHHGKEMCEEREYIVILVVCDRKHNLIVGDNNYI